MSKQIQIFAILLSIWLAPFAQAVHMERHEAVIEHIDCSVCQSFSQLNDGLPALSFDVNGQKAISLNTDNNTFDFDVLSLSLSFIRGPPSTTTCDNFF